MCGESRSVPEKSVQEFKECLPSLLNGYADADIFNADETALYYRQLPERTMNAKNSSSSGAKKSKDRLTLLLCCSMEGEKLPPLAIGKSRSPRCLRGIDINNFPCNYDCSKNAWMTTSIFESWLSEINRRMARQGRSILLFMDNATCHRTTLTLPHVKFAFLPPNCSSVLQPLDQGVIWSFKCIFRKQLLEFVMSMLEDECPRVKIDINLLLALQLIKRSWSAVHPDVIRNSYEKAGFKLNLTSTLVPPPAEEPSLIENFHEYVKIDDRLLEEELSSLVIDDQEVSISSLLLTTLL